MLVRSAKLHRIQIQQEACYATVGIVKAKFIIFLIEGQLLVIVFEGVNRPLPVGAAVLWAEQLEASLSSA